MDKQLEQTIKERFMRKVKMPEEFGGCWLWVAARNKYGYGWVAYGGSSSLAHRVAHLLFIGPIPEGMCILHRCDNPPCVNPEHLFLGTRTDNNEDKKQKGRCASLSGERNPKARLTENQVRFIFFQYWTGKATQTQLVRHQNIGFTVVNDIVRGNSWKHLNLLEAVVGWKKPKRDYRRDEKTKLKIGMANRGKVRSPEVKKKMSESRLRYLKQKQEILNGERQ